ncbi:MAG: CoA transferase, partial [Pseudolabrys sp.]
EKFIPPRKGRRHVLRVIREALYFEPQRRARSAHQTVVPCQLFETADGWIYIMANKEKFFPLLCAELGAPELADDPRFHRFPDRLANRQALSDRLDALFRKRLAAEWVKRLANKVPAAAVATLREVLSSDFAAERDMIVQAQAENGALRMLRSALRDGDARTVPRLGEHSAALLGEAGLSAARIEAVRGRGVIG